MLYGNDGYTTNEVTREIVELVRDPLVKRRVKELGFGLDPSGYTWALDRQDPARGCNATCRRR